MQVLDTCMMVHIMHKVIEAFESETWLPHASPLPVSPSALVLDVHLLPPKFMWILMLLQTCTRLWTKGVVDGVVKPSKLNQESAQVCCISLWLRPWKMDSQKIKIRDWNLSWCCCCCCCCCCCSIESPSMFHHKSSPLWIKVINTIKQIKSIVYNIQTPFLWGNPPTEMKHTKWKASSTVSKISKLKSPRKMQSSVHKRVWQKFGGNSKKKALKQKSREFCLHLLGLREAAPTTNKNTSAATLN